MKKLLFGILFCVSGMLVARGEGVRFLDNVAWKQVVKEAREAGKMVFVDCYTSWCGPCKVLSSKIFPLKEVGDYYNSRFVNVKYDMEKPEGRVLDKLYPGTVTCYPTLLVIDPVTGNIIHKWTGVKQADELIGEAKKALSNRGIVAMDERFREGERDFDFIREYVNTLSQASDRRERVTEVLDIYFKETNAWDDILKQETWEMVFPYLWDISCDYVREVFARYSSLKQLPFVDKKELDRKLIYCIQNSIDHLLEMEFEAGTFTPLKPNPKLYERLEKYSGVFSLHLSYPGMRVCLNLYEYLIGEEWQKAYETIMFANEFGMGRVLLRHEINAKLYMAQYSGDQELTRKIFEDLRQQQGEKGPYMAHIAFVQNCLGDKKGAAESMRKYNELELERLKRIGPQRKHRNR